MQVDYDPDRISFAELLEVFWQSHRPERQSFSRQYLRAVFYHDEGQRRQADESRTELVRKTGAAVKTEVLPLRSFTMAEDYHQKYHLKGNRGLHRELTRFYPDHQDFVDSTAAARLNGYVGGYGGAESLAREIDLLGLSEDGRKMLVELVGRR